MKSLFLLLVLLLHYSPPTFSSLLPFSTLCKKISHFTCVGMILATILPSNALTFPLPASLKNNYVLLRACESQFDAMNEVQTNPVKKLRQGYSFTHLLTQAYSLTHSLTQVVYYPHTPFSKYVSNHSRIHR